jgi:Hypoxia induced protein conserved region
MQRSGVRSRRNAMQQEPVLLWISVQRHTSCVHCGVPIRGMQRSNHRVLKFNPVPCKDCSGRRTMDLLVVVIIAAMLFTVATVFLGVFTMSVGGSTNKTLSTPLMWVRVGFQALTLLLLFAAIRLR